MLITVVKHAGQWDLLALVFQMKPPTFERTVISMLSIVADYTFERYVRSMTTKYPMKYLLDKGKGAQHHRLGRYARDVRFHHTNRPAGNHSKSNCYFSRAHKMYGYKVEVSVLPKG